MTDRRRVYRAHISYGDHGARVWCHYGHVSECGNWVEMGDTRWRIGPEWFASEAEARASRAGEIAAMGARLINQAKELIATTQEGAAA